MKTLYRYGYFLATSLTVVGVLSQSSCTSKKSATMPRKADVTQLKSSHDRAETQLSAILRKPAFLTESDESAAVDHINSVIQTLTLSSKVLTMLPQLSQEDGNSALKLGETDDGDSLSLESQTFALNQVCKIIKYTAEGMKVFASVLLLPDADSEDQAIVPALQEVATSLLQSASNPTCTEALMAPMSASTPTAPDISAENSSALALDESGSTVFDNTAGTSVETTAELPQFHEQPAIPAEINQEALQNFALASKELVTLMGADEVLTGLSFFTELKRSDEILSRANIDHEQLKEVCRAVALIRIPLLSILNSPKFLEAALKYNGAIYCQ